MIDVCFKFKFNQIVKSKIIAIQVDKDLQNQNLKVNKSFYNFKQSKLE